MPATSILRWAAEVQMPVVEHPLVMNMAYTLVLRNYTRADTSIFKKIGGGLNSEGENLPVKDPWHNGHMPGETSGTEVVTVAQ